MSSISTSKLGKNLTPIFDQYLRHADLPVLELKFDDAKGEVAYRWKADEKAFAMPIRVGTPESWQIITPTAEWQTLKTPLGRRNFRSRPTCITLRSASHSALLSIAWGWQNRVISIFFRTEMRLWSLHPSLLDQKGLVALWRESLLAQKVLRGKTTGYRSHPQLARFRQSSAPLTTISAYLWEVHDEAKRREYSFDATKIARRRQIRTLTVTLGQLEFELGHLKNKLRKRDPKRYRDVCRLEKIAAHPLFTVVAGEIEAWERP